MAKKSTKIVSNSENETIITPISSSKSGFTVRFDKKKLRIVVVGAAIVLFALLAWQYTKARSELKKYNDPGKAIQAESEEMVKQIEKATTLPTNETPVPFEIKDINKFKDNPVFSRAQNGDKGLIYQETKWVVIYRPATKQIIAASPINLKSDTGETEIKTQ